MLIADLEGQTLVAPDRLVSETRLSFRSAALSHLERIAQRQATRLLVDLQNTKDIDASGLGVLVLLQKRAREKMIATKLVHVPVALKRMLELTRLAHLFEIED